MFKDPILPNYLPIAGRKIVGFMPFLSVLALCDMQITSFRIWTRVSESTSYDINRNAMSASTQNQ